jgi:hypothetical protein
MAEIFCIFFHMFFSTWEDPNSITILNFFLFWWNIFITVIDLEQRYFHRASICWLAIVQMMIENIYKPTFLNMMMILQNNNCSIVTVFGKKTTDLCKTTTSSMGTILVIKKISLGTFGTWWLAYSYKIRDEKCKLGRSIKINSLNFMGLKLLWKMKYTVVYFEIN